MVSVKVAVSRLQPGMFVRLPLKWNEHPFLLNRFKIKDARQLGVIHQLGLTYVYYDPALSDSAPLSSFAAENGQKEFTQGEARTELNSLWQKKKSRIEQQNNYSRKVGLCEKEFEQSVRLLRSAFKKVKKHPRDAIDELQSVADKLVEQFLHDGPVTLQLVNSEAKFSDIQLHCFNVSILAMMIARARGGDEAFIRDVAFAALVHDIGKIKIPHQILVKTTALTEPESNYLRQHIKYGVDLVETIEGFPLSAKIVINQHHETVDGKGYPLGLKGNEIDEISKIVAITNTFETLCHPNNPVEKRTPHAALSYLFKHGKEKYDLELLATFIKLMGIYPPGTVVQLSNQMIGLVVAANVEHSLSPEVLVYDETIPRHQASVIDINNKGLTITGAISIHRLTDEQKNYLNPNARMNYFLRKEE